MCKLWTTESGTESDSDPENLRTVQSSGPWKLNTTNVVFKIRYFVQINFDYTGSSRPSSSKAGYR